MALSREEVVKKVQEVLVEALGVDDDEVTEQATLMGDLGAESIDFLDILFRLEKSFGIKIPREELFPVEALMMEKANAFAFMAADGRAKKTAIKTGFNDGAKVEVLSGLTGNEAVILVGKLTLADGAAVNATEVK